MGGYCSSFNSRFVYLPEVEEEKKHGKTKTILNKDGKLRVYNRRDRSKSLSEIDPKQELIINKSLRRRYSEHYNNNFETINKSLMFAYKIK